MREVRSVLCQDCVRHFSPVSVDVNNEIIYCCHGGSFFSPLLDSGFRFEGNLDTTYNMVIYYVLTDQCMDTVLVYLLLVALLI